MHRPLPLVAAAAATLALAACHSGAGPDRPSAYGTWNATISASAMEWSPGQTVTAHAKLQPPSSLASGLAAQGYPVERWVVLVTAERLFDANGWMRLPSDERMSTLLTPTGVPIEGGYQGAITDRFGQPFRTPVDELVEMPGKLPASGHVVFKVTFDLPPDLPPGLYRLRYDFGAKSRGRYFDLNGNGLGSRPFAPNVGSYLYTGLIAASGPDVSGRNVDATALVPRMPWVLLADYNSNGYQGVVADEDKGRFALSGRSILQDEVILPPRDDWGNALTYSLEPTLPTESIDATQNLAWNRGQGELTAEVTQPDGKVVALGTFPLGGAADDGNPTTKDPALTKWKPPMDGQYAVKLTGWMMDRDGHRVEGGGTYRFWIARRMTLATATFQGMSYPVGYKYGRDMAFNPPLPADVTMTATLYPSSDPAQARSATSSGKATVGGIFGTAQGMQQLTLDAPGEYEARILAKAVDEKGQLWISAMRHAGVVYPATPTIEAHGKKLRIGDGWQERGETHREGSAGSLEHIGFPYNGGDLLLIASDNGYSNKIEPVLTWNPVGQPVTWDWKLNDVGASNLWHRTSNGYPPHMFPEYLTDREYYYASAVRPGFMGRFIVGDSVVRAPYWNTSPNSFGGQIAAGANGDQPGDLYRFMGGVVIRDAGKTPAYAGFLATGAILPRGSNNNRVVQAGSEDIIGATGEKARFFLVGYRPGMALPVGATWRPAIQIDPMLPVAIHLVLTYPDGRQSVVDGTADASGSFAGADAFTLDVPGVYRYQLSATWNGFTGKMPGLPDAGGEFYVFTPRPAGAAGLTVDLPTQSWFDAGKTLVVKGKSTAATVRYALIMPGAVLAQGDLPVNGGQFQLEIDPQKLHAQVPIYDVRNPWDGKPYAGRVLHLSFLAQEKAPDGSTFWDFRRVVVRGQSVVSTR